VKDRFSGWGEIAGYLGVHARTAQKYQWSRGLKVRRLPGSGPKGPVFALRSDLDAWLLRTNAAAEATISPIQTHGRYPISPIDFAAPVLERIGKVARDIKLYRRNYVLRFNLTRSVRGVQAKVECEFQLHNATNERQPYVQEVTVDDGDHGYVEGMSLSVNAKPVYILKRPAPSKKLIGYSVYCGPEQMIEPGAVGFMYLCRSSWVIHRSENDIWYNHLALPTIGIEMETHAPPEFEITQSFSMPDLVMTGEHLDVAWSTRR